MIVGAGGAVVSIVHVRDVEALSFPAASAALTKKVYVPSPSVYVFGLVHAGKAPDVNRHLKSTPGSASSNEKDGVVSLLAAFGPPVMVATAAESCRSSR